MKPFTKEELRELMELGEEPSVSFFLPTDPVSRDPQQNRIKLKNLLRQAEEQLKETTLRPAEIEKLMSPVETLYSESIFWSHQQKGLAIFVNRNLFRYYRLPVSFEEVVEVGKKFHLKPLLPLLSQDYQYYLLTLSQNQVQLYQCSPDHMHPVDMEGVPESLDETVRYDEPEKQFQFNTGTPQGGGGIRAAAFHGQGIGMENTKKDLLQFFHRVDAGIQQKMLGTSSPLVLAGVDYLFPIYREANTYPQLMDKGIPGNPEELAEKELHQQSLGMMAPLMKKSLEKTLAHYAELDGTGRTSKELEGVILAAYHGRIETLFVATGYQQWGVYHQVGQKVDVQESANSENEDLVNAASLQTYLNGGTVYIVPSEEMPVDSGMAAILRY